MTISAKVIADSISGYSGHRITTFELEYPRFIHSEFMTHRLFSRNAASSRAIPVKRAIEIIRENTAMPIHWGKNQPGMSAKEECNNLIAIKHQRISREGAWNQIRDQAIVTAEGFEAAGYHKQIVNRLLEPFTHIKVILTATDFDNFYWLRNHADAQPEIHELASKMLDAIRPSIPVLLRPGQWHLPYYKDGYWIEKDATDSLEDAIAISSSCSAQVSYRRLDDSLEKARDIYKRLVETEPVHASPFEHQATPIPKYNTAYLWKYFTKWWPEGVTHIRKDGTICSGNFSGWIQNRQLLKNNTCWEYKRK